MLNRISRRAMLIGATLAAGLALSIGARAEDQTVRIATLPYMDYTVFVAAHELGMDKELGLDFEFIQFPLEPAAAQALIRGDIDVGQGALAPLTTIFPQAPELRVLLTNNQFKGLIFVGRDGAIKTFDETLAANGGDFEAARRETLEQFKGKTLTLVKASFEGTVKGVLEDVGVSMDDVEILDFPDDAQAALAFMRGTGDLYIGSLPQEMRLLSEPGYVAVAGAEALGPAGLFFANTLTTDAYLTAHPEVAKKLLAIHFRLARYLREQPDKPLQLMLDYLNQSAGSAMSFEDGLQALKRFIVFQTMEDVEGGVYDPESPNYWKKALDGYIDQNIKLGKLTEGAFDPAKIIVQEAMFSELQNDQTLMDWIAKPLE